MSLSPLFLFLSGPKSISVRMVHIFIEPPAHDNCYGYLVNDGIYSKYFTRQDIILIGRSDLVDNIKNTSIVKPDCAIMAFTLSVKIMGSLLFVRKILWCCPVLLSPVYLPTSCLQGPVTFQNLNKWSLKNKHN